MQYYNTRMFRLEILPLYFIPFPLNEQVARHPLAPVTLGSSPLIVFCTYDFREPASANYAYSSSCKLFDLSTSAAAREPRNLLNQRYV
jgi:hypothetical protein